jgi:hypothetical protein
MEGYMHVSKPARVAIAAAACLVATWIPLAVGIALDVFPLQYWGVLSGYIGLSWLAPAVCLGLATTEWAKLRGRTHATASGIASGIGAGVILLVGVASIMAAGGLAETDETSDAKPALGDQAARTALVMAAARHKISRFGAVDAAACGADTDSLCIVTYHHPACQLWVVENVNGVDRARAVDSPAEGGRGYLNEGQIGCRWEIRS